MYIYIYSIYTWRQCIYIYRGMIYCVYIYIHMCVTYLRITDTFFVSYLLGGFWCQKTTLDLYLGF